MLNSNARPNTTTLMEWLTANLSFLLEQDNISYSLVKTTLEGTTYPSTVLVETNVGVRDILSYIPSAYNSDGKLKANTNIQLISIQ
jgi:hypothetical protein